MNPINPLLQGVQGLQNPDQALSGQTDALSKILNAIPILKNIRGFNAGVGGMAGKPYKPAVTFGGEMQVVGGAPGAIDPTKTIGQLQQESQQAGGKGFLANYDNAVNGKDWGTAAKIIDAVKNAPAGSEMAKYAGSLISHFTQYVLPNIVPKASAQEYQPFPTPWNPSSYDPSGASTPEEKAYLNMLMNNGILPTGATNNNPGPLNYDFLSHAPNPTLPPGAQNYQPPTSIPPPIPPTIPPGTTTPLGQWTPQQEFANSSTPQVIAERQALYNDPSIGFTSQARQAVGAPGRWGADVPANKAVAASPDQNSRIPLLHMELKNMDSNVQTDQNSPQLANSGGFFKTLSSANPTEAIKVGNLIADRYDKLQPSDRDHVNRIGIDKWVDNEAFSQIGAAYNRSMYSFFPSSITDYYKKIFTK